MVFMRLSCILIPALSFLLQTTAQAQPHIQGTIHIKMKDGLIDCQFKLSNLPPLKQYKILLNHGMNIRYFTSDSGQVLHHSGYYNGKTSGEAIEYSLMKNKRDTFSFLPPAFGIQYKGAFPVYDDTLNSFDFKGFIALNGKTLRATEQSKWYPVIYDVSNDRMMDSYTCDITVYAEGARTVFINGCPPSQKKPASFSSRTATPLFLFAGDYGFMQAGRDYLLNVEVDTGIAHAIFRELDKLKAFYVAKLDIPYEGGIYIISHKAVEPFKPGRSWGFTVFPSFAYAGVDFKKLITTAGKLENSNIAFFAHELAHYYFNGKSGRWQWFWLESATEYLSLKAVETFTDTGFYHQRIRHYTSSIKDKKYTPLARITSADEIDNNYRYMYGPLILLCFEKQFGQKATFKVLADIVKKAAKETITLYVFKQIALANKIKEADFNQFYTNYLDADQALFNACITAAEMSQ
jgi:hypothetical protein